MTDPVLSEDQIKEIEEGADDQTRALISHLRDAAGGKTAAEKRAEAAEKKNQVYEAKEKQAGAKDALKSVLGADPTDRQVQAFIRDEASDAGAWVQEMGYSVQPANGAPQPQGSQPSVTGVTDSVAAARASAVQPTPQIGSPPAGGQKVSEQELNELYKSNQAEAQRLINEGRVAWSPDVQRAIDYEANLRR